jgi:hypothetical protein
MAHCFGPIQLTLYYLGMGGLTCKLSLELPVAVPPFGLGEYIGYLAFTIFLESTVFFAIPTGGITAKKKIMMLLTANIVSHPLLTFGLSASMAGSRYAEYILIGEALVIAIESAVFWAFFRSSKIWWVVVINLFSWQIGAWLVA